jgi:hypothetical protein
MVFEMTFENEDLYQAMKACVPAALETLVERIPSKTPPDDETERFQIYWTSDDHLKKLPEYHTTVRLLSECSPIIGQLDTVVGTHRRRTRTPPLARLMKRIVKLGMQGNSLVFDSKHFDSGYLAFEEFFCNISSVTVEAVAPLHGLELSENKTLSLSNCVEISLLTRDEEKKYGYMTETESMEYEREERPWYTPTYALRIRYDLSKIVGDERKFEIEEMDKETEHISQVNREVWEIVNALMLFKAGYIHCPEIRHRTSEWLFDEYKKFPNRSMAGDYPSLYLADEETEEFKRFWVKLQNRAVIAWKALDVAIRRFSYACERYRSEDKIIDLLIAAEALFLTEIGSEKSKSELSYRLALRAGFLLGSTPAERKEIYLHLRKAYKIRSEIVHGATSLSLPLSKDGGQVSLEQFVKTTEQCLRLTIHRFINAALEPDKKAELLSWDDRIFHVEESKDEQ